VPVSESNEAHVKSMALPCFEGSLTLVLGSPLLRAVFTVTDPSFTVSRHARATAQLSQMRICPFCNFVVCVDG
jgi:hypothetical protein